MLSIDVMGNIIEPLCPSEKKVYNLLICGLSIKDIANMLCITPATVQTHKNHIFSKMYVNGQKELMYKRILELEKTILEMKAGQL